MKTTASNQEQKPRAEARVSHAAWGVVKELESRLSPAGAGWNKKAVPGDTRDGEKRALRTLREVGATPRPSLEISRQASPGRRFGAWGLGRAPATAQGLLDRTPRGREGRAGIERVPAARFGAGVPRRPVTDQAAGYLLSSRCVWDAWAGLEPATSGLWARRADRCSTTRLIIRRPLSPCRPVRSTPSVPHETPRRRWRPRWTRRSSSLLSNLYGAGGGPFPTFAAPGRSHRKRLPVGRVRPTRWLE